MNVLEDRHIETKPQLAEANTLTYGTRVDLKMQQLIYILDVRGIFLERLIEAV